MLSPVSNSRAFNRGVSCCIGVRANNMRRNRWPVLLVQCFVLGRGRYRIHHRRLLWRVMRVLQRHTHRSANFAANRSAHRSAILAANSHTRTNFASNNHTGPVGRAVDSPEFCSDNNAYSSPDATTERPADDCADRNSDNRTIDRADADAHEPAHHGTLPFGAHFHSLGVRVTMGRVFLIKRVVCSVWRSVLRRYMRRKQLRVLRAPVSVNAPEPISVSAPEPAPASRADSTPTSGTKLSAHTATNH